MKPSSSQICSAKPQISEWMLYSCEYCDHVCNYIWFEILVYTSNGSLSVSLYARAGQYDKDTIGKNYSLEPNNKNVHKGMFLHSFTRARGWVQKCCISLCSKEFINQMKASPECLNILIYWSKYWADRLRRSLRRNRNISSTDISTLPLYFT